MAESERDPRTYEAIIVELKAASDLVPDHLAQTINYLAVTGHAVGLLLNFGKARLQYRRVVFSGEKPEVLDEDAVWGGHDPGKTNARSL